MSNIIKKILQLLIRCYQVVVSPALKVFNGGQPMCRFNPSCSHYFYQALEEHGVVKGTFLGIKRIFRCHPWGGCGYDPVPTKLERSDKSS